MEIKPTEAPSDGAALVESMLEKKAGKTAESLVIHQEKEEAELPARYDYREEKREVPVLSLIHILASLSSIPRISARKAPTFSFRLEVENPR